MRFDELIEFQELVFHRPAAGVAAVVGPPGRMMAWVVCLIKHIERVSGGRVAMLELNEDADLTVVEGLFKIFVGHPGYLLENVSRDTDVSILAVFDDPQASVDFLHSHGTSFQDALRVHSAAYVFAPMLIDNPSALILSRTTEASALRVFDRVVGHLGIALAGTALTDAHGWLCIAAAEDPSFEDALAAFCAAYDIAEPEELALTPAMRRCVQSILDPMMELARTGSASNITWPIDVLAMPGREDEAAPKVMELAGPPRCLVYGPYFHLPRGRYEVEVVLGVSKDADISRYTIELHDVDCKARAHVHLEVDGIYRCRFYFEQNHPGTRLAMRLLTDESAILGRIAVAHVCFRRIDAAG